jgi:hypothetical protein
MIEIHKISLQVLLSGLRREDLICSLQDWLDLKAVCCIAKFLPEVKQDLINKHLFCNTKTYNQRNWGAINCKWQSVQAIRQMVTSGKLCLRQLVSSHWSLVIGQKCQMRNDK